MIDKAPRATLAAIVKITLFVLAPVYAAFTTLRVGMTTLGLDNISWGQWPEAIFGPMGVNFAMPLFFLALLGPSGITTALWRALRETPRLVVASLHSFVLNRTMAGAALTAVLIGVAATVVLMGPVGALWLAPEAWTSWWTWMSAGLLVALPMFWHVLSTPGPDKARAMVAVGVGVTVAATSLCYWHRAAVEDGEMLWVVPMALVPFTHVGGVLAVAALTARGKTPVKTEG